MRRLEALYYEHGPSLLAYLRRRFGAGEADELLQETFMQAARDHARLDAAESQRAWLFGIARNVGRAAARSRRPTQPLTPDLRGPSESRADPRLEAMREALAKLPDAQREVLELRLVHDLAYHEIAAALAIPIGTVRSRIHHAVRQLRERLAYEPSLAR